MVNGHHRRGMTRRMSEDSSFLLADPSSASAAIRAARGSMDNPSPHKLSSKTESKQRDLRPEVWMLNLNFLLCLLVGISKFR